MEQALAQDTSTLVEEEELVAMVEEAVLPVCSLLSESKEKMGGEQVLAVVPTLRKVVVAVEEHGRPPS